LTDKTLRLLGEACDINDYASVSRISIGERDARLLQLREWMFGKRLHNTADCPACGEKTEWETNTTALQLQALPASLSVRTFNFEKDGYSIHFRLPDSNDIARAIIEKQGEESHKAVIIDCVLAANHQGKKISGNQLPIQLLEDIHQQMSVEDPQADIGMNIKCPACDHQWEARFDIVSFLWTEINSWAQRMLREIYVLARAFGWHEADILNMSPRRRQLYLQMLGT
jgi:hypothetical protein